MNGERLRQVVTQSFDDEELHTLCADLGIDYDSLPGEGKAAKARELVSYMERRGQTHTLVAACYSQRPNSFWREAMDAAIVPARVATALNGKVTSRMLMSQVGRLEIRVDRVEGKVGNLRVIAVATLVVTMMTLGGLLTTILAIGLR